MRRIDMNRPPIPETLRVQLELKGEMAREVKGWMEKYSLEPAATVNAMISNRVAA